MLRQAVIKVQKMFHAHDVVKGAVQLKVLIISLPVKKISECIGSKCLLVFSITVQFELVDSFPNLEYKLECLEIFCAGTYSKFLQVLVLDSSVTFLLILIISESTSVRLLHFLRLACKPCRPSLKRISPGYMPIIHYVFKNCAVVCSQASLSFQAVTMFLKAYARCKHTYCSNTNWTANVKFSTDRVSCVAFSRISIKI